MWLKNGRHSLISLSISPLMISYDFSLPNFPFPVFTSKCAPCHLSTVQYGIQDEWSFCLVIFQQQDQQYSFILTVHTLHYNFTSTYKDSLKQACYFMNGENFLFRLFFKPWVSNPGHSLCIFYPFSCFLQNHQNGVTELKFHFTGICKVLSYEAKPGIYVVRSGCDVI